MDAGGRNLPTEAALAAAIAMAEEMLADSPMAGPDRAKVRARLVVLSALRKLFPGGSLKALGKLVLPDCTYAPHARLNVAWGAAWWPVAGARVEAAVWLHLAHAPQSDTALPDGLEYRRQNMARANAARMAQQESRRIEFAARAAEKREALRLQLATAPIVRASAVAAAQASPPRDGADNGGHQHERDRVRAWRERRFSWSAIAANLGRCEMDVRQAYDVTRGGWL